MSYKFIEMSPEIEQLFRKKYSFSESFFCQECGLRMFPCGMCMHCHQDKEQNLDGREFVAPDFCIGCDRELCCQHDEACIELWDDVPENYYNNIVESLKSGGK